MTSWIHLLAILLLVTGLAGCASPDDGDSPPMSLTVRMKDVAFAPASVTVAVGGTVTWVNDDSIRHTVTPTDDAVWGSQGSGDDPATWLGQDESWSHTFAEAGTFRYYCIPHASQDGDGTWRGMVGTVVVV